MMCSRRGRRELNPAYLFKIGAIVVAMGLAAITCRLLGGVGHTVVISMLWAAWMAYTPASMAIHSREALFVSRQVCVPNRSSNI